MPNKLILLFLLFNCPFFSDAQVYTKVYETDSLILLNHQKLDFNGDGYLDIPVQLKGTYSCYDYNELELGILLNFPNDSFYVHATGLNILGSDYGDYDWGDMDNDGDFDLIITTKTGGGNFIYRNNNGILTELNEPSFYYSKLCATWLDFNQDGWLDVFTSGNILFKGYKTYVYINDHQGGFDTVPVPCAATHNLRYIPLDFNKDGFVDLLAEANNSKGLFLRINNDNSNFTTQTIIPISTGWSLSKLITADYNSDGYTDLMYSNGSEFVVMKNNGTSFDSVFTSNNNYRYLEWGDIDNDGDLDILGMGGAYFRNDGFDQFVYTNFLWNGKNISFADYDNDGDLDFFTQEEKNGTCYLSLYRSDSILFTNQPPVAPHKIFTNYSNDTLTVSWYKGYDLETPREGLSYNVKVSSLKDHYGQVYLNSDSLTGGIRLLKQGNAFQDTFKVINNLPYGWHYVEVQSIDNSFYTSGFKGNNTYINVLEHEVTNVCFDFFPNPTNDFITFRSESRSKLYQLNIFSIQGEMLIDKKIELGERINIEQLSPGSYPFWLKDKEGGIFKGLIIKSK